MFFFSRFYFFRHVFQLGFVVLHDFLRAADPWAFAEYLFNIFSEYDLASEQKFCQLGMTLFVFSEYLLGYILLFVNHLQYLVVNNLCRGL